MYPNLNSATAGIQVPETQEKTSKKKNNEETKLTTSRKY
jgi:hypothetical protein